MRRLVLYVSLLFIFTIPFEGVVVIPGIVTLTSLFGFLLSGLWLLSVVQSGQFRRPHLFHLGMLVFILWNIASIYWTFDSRRTMGRAEVYFQLLLLSLIIWDIYLTRSALRAGMQAYVLGGFVTISFIIIDFLSREAANGRYGTGRDYNEVSLVLALGLPLAWYLAITSNASKRNLLRLLNSAYVPTAFFCVLLSASRGGLLASLPALLFVFLSMNSLKRFQRFLAFVLLIICLSVLLTMVPEESTTRLSETGTQISDGDLTGRGDIWAQAFDVFLDHPLIGVGSGAFRSSIELGKAPHSVYVSILVDVGLIGLLLFAAIMGIVFQQALSQPKLESRLWLAMLLVWTIGVVALTFEHRKPTWLLFTLVVVGANLMSESVERAIAARTHSDQRLPNPVISSIDAT